MQLATIEMDRVEARKRFIEYRDAVRQRHNAEDEQIMRGYRAMSEGRQLISLAQTIQAGGTVEKFATRRAVLPALAIMRATEATCRVETREDGAIAYHPSGYPRTNETKRLVRIRTDLGLTWTGWSWRAMVPPVPPRLRPAHSLAGYHILWEAEWEFSAPPRPPGDPALLRHVGGDLYAVVATWDLTELEKAVLSARR